jgi:hypothetical protein
MAFAMLTNSTEDLNLQAPVSGTKKTMGSIIAHGFCYANE